MSTTASELYRNQSWSKDSFVVSTDPSKIPLETVNKAFALDALGWASPLPEPALREMVENSLCFGLYDLQGGSSPRLVGFSRCITDFVTFLYLTDVWVDAPYQGKGLGRWLVGCVQETIDSMPYLRRSMLITDDWHRTAPFYQKTMGMEVVDSDREHGLAVMQGKGKGATGYGFSTAAE